MSRPVQRRPQVGIQRRDLLRRRLLGGSRTARMLLRPIVRESQGARRGRRLGRRVVMRCGGRRPGQAARRRPDRGRRPARGMVASRPCRGHASSQRSITCWGCRPCRRSRRARHAPRAPGARPRNSAGSAPRSRRRRRGEHPRVRQRAHRRTTGRRPPIDAPTSLRRVINATGVIIHTNLGRARCRARRSRRCATSRPATAPRVQPRLRASADRATGTSRPRSARRPAPRPGSPPTTPPRA